MNPNYQKMLKQIQKMQADMARAQEELAKEEVEASAGGGMVKARVSGDLRLVSINIDPAAVDPDDVEMLEDLVVAAVNEAFRMAQELAQKRLGGLTAGLDLGALGIPGLGL